MNKFVVLVNPCLHGSRSGGVGQPVGLLCVASCLRDGGYSVELVDANALGLSVEDLVSRLCCLGADVVGFSVNTPSVGYVLDCAERVKCLMPGCRVVLGGIHASLFADELVGLSFVDSVVCGEGDLVVLDAVESDGVFESKVDDLKRLPVPAWDLVNFGLYSNALCGGRFGMVMTSRGCPFSCVFCGAHVMCGKRVRYRSVEGVGCELRLLRGLGVRTVLFEDDTFTLNRGFVRRLCVVLKELGLRWWCNTRVDVLDKKLLKIMRDSGCVGVCVGVESGNQKVLDGLKKGITLQQIKDGVRLIKSVGLKCYGYFMVGCPGDTEESLRDTVDLAKGLPFDFAQFSVVTPFPGTELFEFAKGLGVVGEVVDWSVFDWEGEPPNVSCVSVERRRWWLDRAVREFYLRPRVLIKNLSWRGLKAGWRLLRG